METLKRVIAILAIIVGILFSLLWFGFYNWVATERSTTFFEELIREPEYLLFFLPGLALIAFPIWYLRRPKKQEKEEE